MNNLLSEEQEHLLDLPAYLAKAGMAKDLFDLLTDFEFIEAKISAVGTPPLIEDYDLVRNLDPPQPPLTRGEQENTPHPLLFNRSSYEEGLGGDRAETLKLIQGAIRLSAHVLDKNETQLAGHLLGRLMSFKAPEIQALLAQSKQKQKPWLRPFTPSLTPPGTPLLRTLTGHTNWVNAVAITPDGKQAISASRDNSLKLWDLTTGTELFSLTGHTDSVNAVAITPDGKQAISASGDNSLKLWDLQSREVIASFSGDGALNCCAVAPDGVTIVAGEASGRVHFLRLEGVARRG